MKKKNSCLILGFVPLLLLSALSIYASSYQEGHAFASEVQEEITPYKFTDTDKPTYRVPDSSRFTVPRGDKHAPPILYYASFPKRKSYPLAFLIHGSSSEHEDPPSVILLHRFFLKELLDLNIGAISVENWGVSDQGVDKKQFFDHYTRSQRLADHQRVLDYLKEHPPRNWNGKFIFLGVSEGATIARQLAENNPTRVLASILLCGAAEGNWREHLWTFVSAFRKAMPAYLKLADNLPSFLRPKSLPPKTRVEYDSNMDAVLRDPTPEKFLLGYTYKFQADALQASPPAYARLRSPVLVVGGGLDGNISFTEQFVQKARLSGTPITYLSIPDMDHYIRKRPDVLEQVFSWLQIEVEADRKRALQRIKVKT